MNIPIYKIVVLGEGTFIVNGRQSRHDINVFKVCEKRVFRRSIIDYECVISVEEGEGRG